MAEFIIFDEGKSRMGDDGLPATCYFLLSTKSVDGTNPFTEADTLVGPDMDEITGTTYARESQAEPADTDGIYVFTQMTWDTDVNTDWPADVRSIVLATTANNTGVAICAWNLRAGGLARDMSSAGVIENVTPTLKVGYVS
jgi:hypothetical protein